MAKIGYYASVTEDFNNPIQHEIRGVVIFYHNCGLTIASGASYTLKDMEHPGEYQEIQYHSGKNYFSG